MDQESALRNLPELGLCCIEVINQGVLTTTMIQKSSREDKSLTFVSFLGDPVSDE